MAFIYVHEYARQPLDRAGQLVPAGEEPALASYQVAIGVGSAQSAAFNAKTKFISVHADAICSVKFGANPTAVATEGRMAANETRYFGVQPGDKIAVIQNT